MFSSLKKKYYNKQLLKAASDKNLSDEVLLDKIKFFLQNGADVNARNRKGYTPLMLATNSFFNRVECVRFLLQAGANIHAISNERCGIDNALETAISLNGYLCRIDNLEIVTLLLEKFLKDNANDVMALNPTRMLTPDWRKRELNKMLNFSATYGSLECAQLLLQAGADINAKDQMGNTALHLAVRARQPELVEFLLQAGADINAKSDFYDKTAQDIIKEYDGCDYGIAKILADWPAKQVKQTELSDITLQQVSNNNNQVTDLHKFVVRSETKASQRTPSLRLFDKSISNEENQNSINGIVLAPEPANIIRRQQP